MKQLVKNSSQEGRILYINYKQMESEASSGIFTDQKVQKYVLEVLKRMQILQNELEGGASSLDTGLGEKITLISNAVKIPTEFLGETSTKELKTYVQFFRPVLEVNEELSRSVRTRPQSVDSINQLFHSGSQNELRVNYEPLIRKLLEKISFLESFDETTAQVVWQNLISLTPHMSESELRSIKPSVNDLIEKFPFFKKQHIDFCHVLGEWYKGKNKPREALDAISKAYRISEFKDENGLACLQDYLVSLVAQEIVLGLEESIKGVSADDFQSYLRSGWNLLKYCSNDTQKKSTSEIFTAAALLLLRKENQDVPAEFKKFKDSIQDYIELVPHIAYSTQTIPLKLHRNNLERFRKNFYPVKGQTRERQKEIFELFKEEFFKPFIDSVFAILPKPPNYDFLALGSIAKNELRPYSDIEWVILINDAKSKNYFKRVIRLMDFISITLGEVKLSDGFVFPYLVPAEGMHLDGSISNLDEHIRQPKEFVDLMSKPLDDPSVLENMLLKSISLSSQGSSLYQDFEDLKTGKLSKPFMQQKAFGLLKSRQGDYNTEWERVPFESCHFDVKKGFIVLLPYAICDLGLYFGAKNINTLDILKELLDFNVFSASSHDLLVEAITTLHRIRIEHDLDSTSTIDQDALRQIFWSCVFPLYELIKKVKTAQDIEKVFKNVDLIDVSLEHFSPSSPQSPSRMNDIGRAKKGVRNSPLHSFSEQLGKTIVLKDGVEFLAHSASHGNRYAQFCMGWISDSRRSNNRDYKSLLVSQSHLTSMAICLKYDEYKHLGGVDKFEAFRYYQLAASQQLPEAENAVGECYEKGLGTEVDLRKALYWYNLAKEHGSAAAIFNLASIEFRNKNLVPAIKLYEEAARRGIARAQNRLGLCYQRGEGVIQNLSEANKWFAQAAAQKYYLAEFNLAVSLEKGEGFEQEDPSQAYLFYLKAAYQDHPVAQRKVAEFLLEGVIIPQDDKEAFDWLQKASKHDEEAYELLIKCYEKGRGVEKNLNSANLLKSRRRVTVDLKPQERQK